MFPTRDSQNAEYQRLFRIELKWIIIDGEVDQNECAVNCALPERIKLCWVFVLKRDVPSGCHYHPNSVQHMVMVEGQGQSSVGNLRKEMVRFGTPGQPPESVWYVINEGVPHEFFPEETEMVVVSFHTCEARELEEVACGSGAERLYLNRSNQDWYTRF